MADSAPTPRSRAEAEAMLKRYKIAIQDIERTSIEGGNDTPTMVARKQRAQDAYAALLAALTGGGG